jgi:hypothetical protein
MLVDEKIGGRPTVGDRLEPHSGTVPDTPKR